MTNLESRISACYSVRLYKYLLNELYPVHPGGIRIIRSYPGGKKFPAEALCN